jgi:hypothetical protein
LLSALSFQLSALSYQLPATNYQLSAISLLLITNLALWYNVAYSGHVAHGKNKKICPSSTTGDHLTILRLFIAGLMIKCIY